MRSQPSIRLLTALFSLSALLLPVSVSAGDNQVTVQCVNQAGQPVSGAKIMIQQIPPQEKAKDKKSDKQGKARFDKLDDGVYRIWSHMEGYDPALYEFVVLKENASQANVELKFTPGSVDKQLYFENKEVAQKAFDAMNQAIQDLQAGKFADAENKLKVSVELNPSNPDAFMNLAIALIQQHKWEPAEAALTRAKDLSSAYMMLEQKDPSGAQSPYAAMHQRVTDLLAKLPGLRLRVEAGAELSAKNFEGALAKYNEALKSFPDDPDIYYNIALAQANMKNYDEALKAIDKAVQLRPGEDDYQKLKKQIGDYKENENILQAKGILEEADKLYQQKQYNEALQKYEVALPLIPEKSQAIVYVLMAKSQAGLGNNDQAVQDFKKAIELAPDNSDYRKEYAQFYMNQKNYDEALNVYADPKTSGSKPADETLLALGKQLADKGNNDVALIAYEKALKANPDNAEVYYEMGMLYFYNKKDNEHAKEALTKYVEVGKEKAHLDNAKAVLVVIEKKNP